MTEDDVHRERDLRLLAELVSVPRSVGRRGGRFVQLLDCVVDVPAFDLDGLHVQTSLGNQAVTDRQEPSTEDATSSEMKSGTPSNTDDQFASTCARPSNARLG